MEMPNNPRLMLAEVIRTVSIDPHLAELSRRCCDASGPDWELDYEIALALRLPKDTAITSSLDASIAFMRREFPTPDWKYGFQDAGDKGYTCPLAWINNGQCAKTGFANDVNFAYRYFERCATTVELAFAAVVLHAASYHYRPAPIEVEEPVRIKSPRRRKAAALT